MRAAGTPRATDRQGRDAPSRRRASQSGRVGRERRQNDAPTRCVRDDHERQVCRSQHGSSPPDHPLSQLPPPTPMQSVHPFLRHSPVTTVLKCLLFLCPDPNRRGIKRCFCLTSDVSLTSVAYIGPKSRKERPIGRPKLARM